jgi:hypothetical protein
MAKMSIKGIVFTSAFGPRTHSIDPAMFHFGADYGPPTRNQTGVPLFAIFAGKVTTMTDQHGANGVRIGSRATEAVEYWHLARFADGLGSTASEGDLLGEMGTTGLSTGIHVHVEHWVRGTRLDPVPFIDKQASKAVARGFGDTEPHLFEEDDMYSDEDRARDDVIATRAKLTHEAVGRIENHVVQLRRELNLAAIDAGIARWGITDETAGARVMLARIQNAIAELPDTTLTPIELDDSGVDDVIAEVEGRSQPFPEPPAPE